MKIQWYPGHMTKAMRMMEEQIKICDGVIYVLDARCPVSAFNPVLRKMFGAKPVIYVLCKGDLADGGADAIAAVIGKSAPCLRVNAFSPSSRKTLEKFIKASVAGKRERYARRGAEKNFRFMVAGVPNTGKSTIINLLAGGKRALTGDRAGVTRGKQWISCDGFDLLDTPGTCPPYFDNETFATRLAFVGSINDDILPFDELASELLEEMKAKYPERLEERYGTDRDAPVPEMMDAICARRGFILRGGEYDYDRACHAVVDDFRSGKTGAVTLDTPEDCAGLVF